MSQLLVSYENGIQKIIFNRPEKKNALSDEIYQEVIELLKYGSENSDVTLTVITGNGEYFSSGRDFSPLSSSSGDRENKSLEIFKNWVSVLIDYPKLLIAIVNGPAIGISVTTLALYDFVFASDTASFLTPFSKLGICPEGCSTYTFPKIFGYSVSNEILYLNKKLNVQEAKQFGFISEIYTKNQIDTILWPKIYEWAKLPLKTLMYSKSLIRGPILKDLHETNRIECERLQERLSSEEFLEAIMKFLTRKQSKL